MSEFVRLAPDQLEQLADLIAARLRAPAPTSDAGCLVDARTVAVALGTSSEWVRAHADELGVVRLGDGPRPRLRFDLDQARAAWAARSLSERSQAPDPAPEAGARRRRSSATGTNVELLPIRPASEARRAA